MAFRRRDGMREGRVNDWSAMKLPKINSIFQQYRSIPKGRPTEICRESLEVKYVSNTLGSRLHNYTILGPRGIPKKVRDTRYLAFPREYFGIFQVAKYFTRAQNPSSASKRLHNPHKSGSFHS
jgi:hypothetical protein